MSTTIGRKATLEISDDDVTYVKVGKMTSIGEALSTGMADETNNDSDGWTEEQPADSQMVVSGSGKYNEADAGQAAMLAASIGKLKKFYRFRPGGTGVGLLEYKFQGHAIDFNVDTETSSVQDLSLTVNSTGVVTSTAQV